MFGHRLFVDSFDVAGRHPARGAGMQVQGFVADPEPLDDFEPRRRRQNLFVDRLHTDHEGVGVAHLDQILFAVQTVVADV